MKTITPKPNTFYVKKQLTDDIGVIPCYADAYIGLTPTFDIKSNPDTSFYLVESKTVSPNDFIYGEGNISEMYLSLYVNTLTSKNAQTPNYLDVYNMNANVDITEGNLVITSGAYNAPILLYNSHNTPTPWIVEDFDGTNKDFMDMPSSKKQMVGMSRAPLLVITRANLMKAIYETNRDPPENNYDWSQPWANLKEEVSAAYDWTKFYAGATASNLLGTFGPMLFDSGAQSDEFFIQKGNDGLYRASVAESTAAADTPVKNYVDKVFAKRLDPMVGDAQYWLSKGANWWAASTRTDMADSTFDQFDEDFQEKCTQFNSIFSNLLFSPDVRDIKDQTLEGPGDTPYFIAYSYANLVNSDAPSNGRALRFKSFWENYAGDATGAEGVATSNPFGFQTSPSELNQGPLQQTTSATVYGIPQPTPIDITTSGTGRPSYAPEIEIVMKINQMDLTTQRAYQYGSGGDGWETGSGSNTLDRSFSIWFNDNAPAGSDDTNGGGLQLGTAAAMWRDMGSVSLNSRQAPAIIFINENESDGYANCYTNSSVFNTYNNWFFKRHATAGSGSPASYQGLVNADDYMVKVPIGEWFRMRIKLNMYTNSGNNGVAAVPNASGGGSMVYFPDMMNDNGQYKFAPLAHAGSWGQSFWGDTMSAGTLATIDVSGNNSHFPNMTMWMNNMRSINVVPNGVNANHVNNSYTSVDTVPNDDKTVDVLVDSISFHQWGPDITNATICTENGMGRLTKIPAPPMVTPTFYPGNNTTPGYTGRISVHPTGTTTSTIPDNYFGQDSAITASYMTFGFNEATQISNNTTDANNFLFNNFSTGREATVQPITMVSGGYFTATNYKGLFTHSGQNGWFDNLTVGDATKAIQITGGAASVDNFVQKGLVKVKSAFSGWVKTGNPLAAAKVISSNDDGFKIVVDKPEVFDVPLNTPLCVELNNVPYAYLRDGSGSIGYYDVGPATKVGKSEPLVQTHKRKGNTIFLSRSIHLDDARSPGTAFQPQFNAVRNKEFGAVDLQQYGQTNYGLTKVMISPYQYWMNMALLNVNSSAPWGHSFADTTHSGTKALATRTYDGIVPVSGGSVFGTSYNEFLFNDGIYSNEWSLSLVDTEKSVVNLNTDFGYGSINMNSDPDSVPDSDGGVGRVGRDFVVAGQNYIDMGSYAYTTKPQMNSPFNFLVKPTYMNLFDGLYACNINTKDATTNKPLVVYGVKDNLPVVNDLLALPSVKTDEITDPVQISALTKSNATDVLLTWAEDGDDINHRILWVDTQSIQNKYHRATFIAPLNENSSTVNYYTSAANYLAGTSVALTGTNVPDIEGACGYAFSTDGSGPGVSSSTGVTLGSTDEFTFTCQAKPNTLARLNHGCIFNASSSTTTTKFDFFVGTYVDGAVKVYVNEVGNVMESTTKYNLDGKQPLAITVTYNKNLSNNNLKLYINGRLEDTKDYTTNFACGGATNTVNIGDRIQDGGTGGVSRFNGTIDEITFHDKCAYVPTNHNNYTLKTSELPDLTTGISNKYQARLFLYDYHNIRGASPTEVARSNSASWKITGVT
jgi:hypothetical protein